MSKKKLAKERVETLLKACNHEETEYIPSFLYAGNALLSYAESSYWEIENNAGKYLYVVDKLVSKAHFDASLLIIGGNPRSHEALENRTETFLGPDGVSMQHVQLSKMKEDEYPKLIENMDKFVKEVLIPRKYTSMFNGDRKAAINSLKVVIEELALMFTGPGPVVNQKLNDDYGIPTFWNPSMFIKHPLDVIFDRFRGFTGTISDIRRRPKQVLQACEMIYKTKCSNYENVSDKFPFALSMPHIPSYLNVKQFEKFYWPYMKEMFTNIAKGGNKVVMALEGRWAHLLDFFLELPKDSCVIMVDDDDIFEVNKRIGHHQVLCGGAKVGKLILESKQTNIDYAKKVIDECAPGGGFIFNTDKMWVCKGDINQNLIDVYNFAHKYGKK